MTTAEIHGTGDRGQVLDLAPVVVMCLIAADASPPHDPHRDRVITHSLHAAALAYRAWDVAGRVGPFADRVSAAVREAAAAARTDTLELPADSEQVARAHQLLLLHQDAVLEELSADTVQFTQALADADVTVELGEETFHDDTDLHEALEKVSEPARSLIRDHHLGGTDLEEAASRAGIDVTEAQQQVFAALASLGRLLPAGSRPARPASFAVPVGRTTYAKHAYQRSRLSPDASGSAEQL